MVARQWLCLLMPNQLMCPVKTTSQVVYLPLGRENDLKIAWILWFTTAFTGTNKTDLELELFTSTFYSLS